MWQKAIFFIILGVLSYQDFKTKKISFHIILTAGIIGLFLQIITHQYRFADLLAGIGIGIFVCLFSVITRGKIGVGDGMVIVLGGLYLGFEQNMTVVITAMYSAGAAALLLMLIKKRRRNYRMPFIPFLFTAYVYMLICEI